MENKVIYYQDRNDETSVARAVYEGSGVTFESWNYQEKAWKEHPWVMGFCHDYANTRVINEKEAKKAIAGYKPGNAAAKDTH